MPYYQQQSRLTGFGFRPNFGNYTAAFRAPGYGFYNFQRPVYGTGFGAGAGFYRARSVYRPDPYGTSYYGPAAVYGGGQPRYQQQNCPRPLPATTSFDLDVSSTTSRSYCPCPQVQICQ